MDPFGGRYGGVLKEFATKPTPEAQNRAGKIFDKVQATADSQPHAFLVLTNGDQVSQPVITLMHSPFSVQPPMGSNSEPVYLMFQGDAPEGLPPDVVLAPTNLFAQTSQVAVPTLEMLDVVLDASTPMAGPYSPDDDGVEVITTRKAMYLPPKFVPIALERPSFTTFEAWTILGQAIRGDAAGDNPQTTLSDYGPLLDWLRAACTLTSQHEQIASWDAAPQPPFPVTAAIRHKTKHVLNHQLPGLYASGNQPMGSGAGTTEALQKLTDEVIRANNEASAREKAGKEKTPSDYWGHGLVMLLRITGVANETELPPVYHLLANSTKRTELATMAEHLREVADGLGLLAYTPVVTPSLVKKITNLQLGHTNQEDLDGGIHPFITAYRDPHTKANLEAAVVHYDQVNQGAGASISDLEQLRKAEKVGMPLTMVETTYALMSFRILVHVLLGPEHPFALAYNAFLQAWRRDEILISRSATTSQAFGQMLRYVQIRVSHWFTDQLMTPEPIELPDLVSLLRKLKTHEPWQPPMPASLHPLWHQAPPARSPSLPVTPSPPASPASPPARDSGRGTRITNTTYKTDFKDFKDLNLPLKTVRDKAKEANKPVPSNAKGTEHCLSYHVAGFCWDNCTRSEDHRTHTAAEHKALLAWCKECYRAGGPE